MSRRHPSGPGALCAASERRVCGHVAPPPSGTPRSSAAALVRVWARLPEPKLPQWVDPTPLDAGEVEVWRRGEACWQRYVVRVGLVVSIRRAEDHMPEGVTHYTNVDAAPPDVWVEAGLRAAAMLRKANR